MIVSRFVERAQPQNDLSKEHPKTVASSTRIAQKKHNETLWSAKVAVVFVQLVEVFSRTLSKELKRTFEIFQLVCCWAVFSMFLSRLAVQVWGLYGALQLAVGGWTIDQGSQKKALSFQNLLMNYAGFALQG